MDLVLWITMFGIRYIEKYACRCWCGGHTSCRRNRHNCVASGFLPGILARNKSALKKIQRCCFTYMCDLIELIFTHGVRKCPFYLLVIFELRFHAKSTFTKLSVIGKWSCRIIFLAGFRSPQILPKIHFWLQNGVKTANLSNSLKCKVFRRFLRWNPEKHRQYKGF